MRKPILPVRTIDDQLIRDEGWENTAYPDPLSPAGKAKAAGLNPLGLDGAPWTIGVGHTGPEVHQGLVWDDVKVQTELKVDILKHERAMEQAFPWVQHLDLTRYNALLNMSFNLGIPKLSKFKKLLAALQAGNWPEAYTQALDSTWAKQVGERAERLAKQFRDGIWY